MSFAPLRYAWEATTIWHCVALAAFMAPTAWGYLSGSTADSSITSSLNGVIFVAFMICWMYFLVAPLLGQVFGDKFDLSAVWPSSVALGVTMSAAFVTFALSRAGRPLTGEDVGGGVFAFAFFSVFLGSVLNLVLWLMPRTVGYGFFDMPKLSWGVQL